MAYPGLMTLIPVLGTVLIIACHERCPANRLLALKPLVWIGLISYPLYLWHWPILSYFRIMESGSPPRGALWAGALLAVLLAALTWRFIEQPLRRASLNSLKRRFVLSGLCASMTALFLASYGIVSFNLSEQMAQPSPLLSKTRKTEDEFPHQDAACLEKFPAGEAPFYCRMHNWGKGERPVLSMIGDSHVHAPFFGIARYASEYGFGVISLGENGCPPLFGTVAGSADKKKKNCAKTIDTVFDFLARTPNITHVLISMRGPLSLTGKGFGSTETGENWTDAMLYLREDANASHEMALWRGLEETLLRFRARGIKIALLLQVPELGVPAQDCLTRPLTLTHAKRCQMPYPVYQERMRPYRELVAELKARHNDLIVIDPEPLFCDEKECSGFRDGQLLYIDDDHLNINGAVRVAPLILDSLGLPRPSSTQ
jgi:hypothetical protein